MNFDSTSDPPARSNILQILRRLLEPESGAETAGLVAAGFVPGVGEAMDAGEIALGIADRSPLRVGIGALALAMGPLASTASLKAAGRAVAPAAKRGINAVTSSAGRGIDSLGDKLRLWHGSPSKFDKFDISHRLSGEGANIAGPGHYFGEARGTGEYYANRYGNLRRDVGGYDYVTPVQSSLRGSSNYPGGYLGMSSQELHMDDLDTSEVLLSYLDPIHRQRQLTSGFGTPVPAGDFLPRNLTDDEFMQAVKEASGDVDRAIKGARPWGGSGGLRQYRATQGPMSEFLAAGEPVDATKLRSVRDALESITPDDIGDFRRGYLYEVDVDADAVDFLDLDKSLLATSSGRNFALAAQKDAGRMAISEDSAIDMVDAMIRMSEEYDNIGSHVEPVEKALDEFSRALEASLRGEGRIPEDVILRARGALENAISRSPSGNTSSRLASRVLRSLEMDNAPIHGNVRGWMARSLMEGRHGKEGLEGLMDSSGIYGVRFKDAMSRTPGLGSNPTYNYVVSRDAPISIRKRYADGGMVEDENVLKRWLSQSRPQR